MVMVMAMEFGWDRWMVIAMAMEFFWWGGVLGDGIQWDGVNDDGDGDLVNA